MNLDFLVSSIIQRFPVTMGYLLRSECGEGKKFKSTIHWGDVRRSVRVVRAR